MYRVSRKRLIVVCRDLGTMLAAGLPVSRALEAMTSRTRLPRLRAVLKRVGQRVQGGATLAQAFREQGGFPPLFLHMVAAGEEGGALDRVLSELLRFYELQQRLWRHFLARIALPVFEYIAAVAVVCIATYILNMLSDKPGGVLPVLLIGYGVPLALLAFYGLIVKPLGGTRACHETVLRIPAVGKVMLYLALARFSLVLQVMMEAGVPITEALARSLEATDNQAFAARATQAAQAIQGGSTFTNALDGAAVFPAEYLEIVQVAEESGTLSDRMGWLSTQHSQRAEFALSTLASVLGWLIWIAVAAVIITFIFMIFSRYLGTLRSFGL